MKLQSTYRKAIEFIAKNELDGLASDLTDVSKIKKYFTVKLIATIFEVKKENIALDIQKFRIENWKNLNWRD